MKDLKAKDIMNTEVLSVRDDMTVQELADFLTEREILGAPVVDSEGEVVGVLHGYRSKYHLRSPQAPGKINPRFL